MLSSLLTAVNRAEGLLFAYRDMTLSRLAHAFEARPINKKVSALCAEPNIRAYFPGAVFISKVNATFPKTTNVLTYSDGVLSDFSAERTLECGIGIAVHGHQARLTQRSRDVRIGQPKQNGVSDVFASREVWRRVGSGCCVGRSVGVRSLFSRRFAAETNVSD